MDVLELIIFLDKLFRDVGWFGVSVFGTGYIGLEVENSTSNILN